MVCLTDALIPLATTPGADELVEKIGREKYVKLKQLRRDFCAANGWQLRNLESYDFQSLKTWPHSKQYRYYGLETGKLVLPDDHSEIEFTISSASVDLSESDMPSGYRSGRPDKGVVFSQWVLGLEKGIMPDETISINLGDTSIPICCYVLRPKNASDTRVRRCFAGWFVNGKWQLPPKRFDADFIRSLNRHCQERDQSEPGWQDFLYVNIGWWEDAADSRDSKVIIERIFGCISKIVADKESGNSSKATCLDSYLNDLELKR